MYSIENPSGKGRLPGVGAQVMGPDDSYLIQYSEDVNSFWADTGSLALGACFKRAGQAAPPRVAVTEGQFNGAVAEGFQATLTTHQGNIRRQQEERAPGRLPSTVSSCKWSITVDPQYGWGPRAGKQQSTAGWLAALPVFEPHWQIMMARGLASGWVEWNGQRTEFQAAPAYWEKNWGGGFPDRWFWVQCNSWDTAGCDAAFTAVGAKRGILNLPSIKEDVGLIGVHFNGQFVELVPWSGSVSWDVAPWGRWTVSGRSEEYEALVEATCDNSGTPLRAPTADDGLAPRCRDSFFGRVRLRVWRLNSGGRRQEPPLLDAQSSSAAVEIGGGPWDQVWQTEARMREPLKSLVKLPIDLEGATSLLPPSLKPPGL